MSAPEAPKTTAHARRMDTKTLTALAMFTALAYVVMYLSKWLPQVAGFLQFELKETVICIGGFLYGPVAAAMISILVPLIEEITVGDTGVIGLIMNIFATCSFCCTASYIYKRNHTQKGAVLALSAAVVALTVVMLLWNYLITPLYMTAFTRAEIAAMLPTLFLPFNLVKGGMNMATTLLLYKPIVTAMRKAGLVPPSKSTQEKKFNAGFLLFSLALLATFVTFALVLAGVI